jgi:uncharacterized membrane protein YbaN (DUF454 family)
MRRLQLYLGYVSLALGAIGAVLPLLPTTPFLLVACWCFARSNPALAARLYDHPRLGPFLQAWRDQGAIPRRAKYLSVTVLALSYASTVWLLPSRQAAIALGLIMGGVALYLLTRPTPQPRHRAERDESRKRPLTNAAAIDISPAPPDSTPGELRSQAPQIPPVSGKGVVRSET